MVELAWPEPRLRHVFYGHERQHRQLRAAFERPRAPHGWLLKGAPGIGKATLAFRLARELLAIPGDPAGPHDPASRVFRMIADDAHPDLHVLTPAEGRRGRRGEIKVEEVRDRIEQLHRTAAFNGFRVLLVDSADDLNRNAANALLKLLEEPPRRLIVIMTCQQVGRVPPTILSRCAQLRLGPLAPVDLQAGLEELAPDVTASRRAALVQAAEGSLGRALRYAALDWDARLRTIGEQLSAPTPANTMELLEDLGGISDQAGFAMAAELLIAVSREAARARAGFATPVPEPLAARATLAQWSTLWNKMRGFAARVDGLNLDPAQSLLTMIHALSGQDTRGLDPA